MKKRIVALILTVVMSLLALSSCGSFDFVEEDLGAYASFDYNAFKAALQKLEIEDGDFTTNSDTRAKLVSAQIYNTIADKIIADTDEDAWLKSGTLTDGDTLYFVYYATDADGNVFFGSNMNESTITASSTKDKHVIKLDDYLDGEDDEWMKLLRDNLAEVDLKDYIYSMLTASEIEADAEKALRESNSEATADEIKAAKAEAIKVKAGDVLYISFSREHKVTDAEGVETVVKEKASYQMITVDASNPLHAFFLAEDSVANVGGTLEVFKSKEGDKVTTTKTFDVTEGEVTYTYSDVKFLWKVESAGQPIASFTYTPYDEKHEVTPDSLYNSGDKVDLKDKELTYHIFPVYAIDTPAFDEITAEQILYYVYGSKLTDKSLDILGDDTFVNGSEKLSDLLSDVADIFDTKKENNEFYKEGSDLKKLLDAYDKAVKDGGDKPTDAQKTAINDAKEALTDAQNATLKTVIAKIVAATSGDKKLSDEIFHEYEHNTMHSLKESYDSDILKKVQTAVWELIDESVKVTGYPEDLLKEYVDHLYESYEYNYYKGKYDTNTSNFDKYDSLTEYLEKTLKVSGKDKINEALEKEAKGYIDPIIKVYVVAKACEADAVSALVGEGGYIDLDIKSGAYDIDEEAYRETYGDAADEKIAEAKENAEEAKQAAIDEAGMFLVDDEYMKNYKKEIGSAYYKQLIAEHGEINLRAAFQFNRLFYYLTSTNLEFNEDEGHTEIKYTEDGNFLDFRTVKYTIAVETEDEGETEDKD